MRDSFGRLPERPVEQFVPDGYRSRRLTDDVREYVERTAMLLAESYHFEYVRDDEVADYDETKHDRLSGDPWKWYGRGSERTIASLGRTYQGVPLWGDFMGVVVKFNPWLRTIDDDNPVTAVKPAESGNLSELAIWKHACDHGHDEFFADILDYSESGDWLAMKQVIPVYKHGEPTFANNPIDYISAPRAEINVPAYLADTLPNLAPDTDYQGYDPHIKDGNVGFDPDTGEGVMVDYGAHCPVIGFDTDDLIRYVLETEAENTDG